MTRGLISILAISLLLGQAASAQTEVSVRSADPIKLEDTTKLTVRGEAELEKPADQMHIRIGVVTKDKEAGEALRDNSTQMRDVVKALEKSGLTKDEYETGRFRIRPTYSRRPRQPGPDWEPMILGYEVSNSINIKTKKLDLAGEVIENSNRAGANKVEVVGFDLSDKRRYRAESIQDATRNALADARSLADAAGLRLVRIIAINLDHTPVQRPGMAYATRGMAMADSSAAPPIEPGNVTVRAGVTIVYEITSKDGSPQE